MRRAILLIFLVVSLVVVRDTSAQATQTPKCDLTTVFNEANNFKASGDLSTDAQTLITFQQTISVALATCNGLRWTVEKSSAKVIGPIKIPAGTFKTSVITTGYFIVNIRVLDGKCASEDQGNYPLFDISPGNASNGAETLIDSSGCTAILQVDNPGPVVPWTLWIEPIQ